MAVTHESAGADFAGDPVLAVYLKLDFNVGVLSV